MRQEFDNDTVLVAALRAGDESAFAYLLDRYDAALRRTARSYVPTPDIADEVVQDAWLGVIRGIDRFEGRSSLKTWIYQVLLNTARSRGVRESRSVPFSSVGPDDDQPTFSPDRFQPPGAAHPGGWAAPPQPWDEQPHERVQAAETLDRVRSVIDRLPATQRVVITLRDIEGWSSDEVCNVLDITATNQRVLLHRARARVREDLERYFESATV